MIEKILKEINRLKNELDGYSASEALDYIEAYINAISEESESEDLDYLVISLEETIGTSPHSREVIKEHLQKAAEWQKEQMMKDAVEAEVMYPASSSTLQIRYKLPKNTKLKYGDKVKIIIVKTE